MDISVDIHGKSVDMDMDGKFYIHDKPEKMKPVLTKIVDKFIVTPLTHYIRQLRVFSSGFSSCLWYSFLFVVLL